MKRDYNRFFERYNGARLTGYVYVNTNGIYTVRGRNFFKDTVEFDVVRQHGGLASNYPVVFEDFTTKDGTTLVEITLDGIPPAIKGKYTRWENVQ